MMHDMDMGPAMWWMMGFGSLTFLLFWGGVIGVAVWVINRLAPQRSDAAETLEERYARGELSREEFLRTKEDLKA